MVAYGFEELSLKRIEATASSLNLASHRVLEKAGFTREGFLAAFYLKDGVLIDVYMFSLLDWHGRLRPRQQTRPAAIR